MRRREKQLCDLHYEKDPRDYQISEEDLKSIFSSKDLSTDGQFNLSVANEHFSFVEMRTVDNGVQFSFTCDNENMSHAILLKSLLEGDLITIDTKNCSFLKQAAQTLNIKELERVCAKYEEKGYISPGAKSIFRNVLKWTSSFLRHCSIITKLFMTLWDMIGIGIVIGFFANNIILLLTMGLHTIQNLAFVFCNFSNLVISHIS